MRNFICLIFILFASVSFADSNIIAFMKRAETLQKDSSAESKIAWNTLINEINLKINDDNANADIYALLGNAYLFSGEIGNAIYAYQKALKYTPFNDELINNLNYARKLCGNKFDPNLNKTFLEKYILSNYIIKKYSFYIFAVSWLLIFMIPLLKTKISEMKFLWIVSIIFASLSISILALWKYDTYYNKYGVIVVDDTIARKGANEIFMPAFKEALKDGVEFSILNEKNGWFHIKLPDGNTAWIIKENAKTY